MSLKNPVTPPGIDPGTVRIVAQRLNHYATPGVVGKRDNHTDTYPILTHPPIYLTPCSTDVIEKLMACLVAKKFPTFCD